MMASHSGPAAPEPLEAYAVQFDALFHSSAQRRSFRTYLASLPLPRERPKTLTTLAGAEPLVQAQAAPVQRLQRFVFESHWDAQVINAKRLALLRNEPPKRHPRRRACSSLTTRATARTAAPPITWRANTWARWARSTIASWR